MKNLGTVLVCGVTMVAGYFIGFYEMKNKVIKIMLESELQKKKD